MVSPKKTATVKASKSKSTTAKKTTKERKVKTWTSTGKKVEVRQKTDDGKYKVVKKTVYSREKDGQSTAVGVSMLRICQVDKNGKKCFVKFVEYVKKPQKGGVIINVPNANSPRTSERCVLI
jgi:hypothetical protein